MVPVDMNSRWQKYVVLGCVLGGPRPVDTASSNLEESESAAVSSVRRGAGAPEVNRYRRSLRLLSGSNDFRKRTGEENGEHRSTIA